MATSQGPKNWRRRLFRRPFVLTAVAGLPLLVLTTGAAVSSYTSQSAFCATCHEMTPSYDAWVHSTHYNPETGKTAECVDCHIAPGFVDSWKDKIYSLKDVYYHLTADNSPEAWQANREERIALSRRRIRSEACIRCHDPAATAPNARTVDHAKFDGQTHCLDCHKNLMGGPSGKGKVAGRSGAEIAIPALPLDPHHHPASALQEKGSVP